MESEHKHKILMVHNYYQIPGGEDTVVENEKRLLEEYGHEVVLYTRHNNELKSMSPLQKLCLPFATVFNPRTYWEIKKIIRDEKIEIVHVHNTLNLISPAVYYAAIKMKVPVVQTIHNFRFLCPGATFYRNGHICEDCVNKGLRCAVKHKCYRGSRPQTLVCVIGTWIHRHTGILGKINYICLTVFNREKLLQLKQVKSYKVFVKPNFTFQSHIDSKQPTKDYYLFIGRIEEIKGVRVLIEAFSRMPNRKLVLAGDGPLYEELMKSTQQQHFNNISFLGRLNHDVLLKKIGNAKAVILPSQIYEGFPMTVPESFSMSTPMIVGDIGNCGALIIEGYTGTKFIYNSVDSLVEAIDRFETQNIELMGKNAYQMYVESFSSYKNYEKLENIYYVMLKVNDYMPSSDIVL